MEKAKKMVQDAIIASNSGLRRAEAITLINSYKLDTDYNPANNLDRARLYAYQATLFSRAANRAMRKDDKKASEMLSRTSEHYRDMLANLLRTKGNAIAKEKKEEDRHTLLLRYFGHGMSIITTNEQRNALRSILSI